MPFVSLEKMHRLHDGYRKPVQVAGRNLLFFQHDGQSYLVENSCPHAGWPLDRASIRDGYLQCPAHGIRFELPGGRATNCDDKSCQLRMFALAYRNNEIGVWTDDTEAT